MADVLVDANFLVAIGYPRDRNHVKAKTFAVTGNHRLLVPDVVLYHGAGRTDEHHPHLHLRPS